MKKLIALTVAWLARSEVSRAVLLLILCCALVRCAASGQVLRVRSQGRLGVTGSLGGSAAVSPGELIRAIQDPNTGLRWLLVRSKEHPGGPGRLMLANARSEQSLAADGGLTLGSTPVPPDRASEVSVIRAGDLVRVEEHTAVADVRLEAVALEAATVGAPLTVRLKIGGRVEHAVALAPGRAALTPLSAATAEARP